MSSSDESDGGARAKPRGRTASGRSAAALPAVSTRKQAFVDPKSKQPINADRGRSAVVRPPANAKETNAAAKKAYQQKTEGIQRAKRESSVGSSKASSRESSVESSARPSTAASLASSTPSTAASTPAASRAGSPAKSVSQVEIEALQEKVGPWLKKKKRRKTTRRGESRRSFTCRIKPRVYKQCNSSKRATFV